MKTIYPYEKFSIFSFLHIWTKNVFNDARLAMNGRDFWRNIFSILSFRSMQFWGTYKGYAQEGAISKSLRRKFYYPKDISTTESSKRQPESGGVAINYSSLNRDIDCE